MTTHHALEQDPIPGIVPIVYEDLCKDDPVDCARQRKANKDCPQCRIDHGLDCCSLRGCRHRRLLESGRGGKEKVRALEG